MIYWEPRWGEGNPTYWLLLRLFFKKLFFTQEEGRRGLQALKIENECMVGSADIVADYDKYIYIPESL